MTSQPAPCTAGVMNLVQMSRSLRAFLSIPVARFGRLSDQLRIVAGSIVPHDDAAGQAWRRIMPMAGSVPSCFRPDGIRKGENRLQGALDKPAQRRAKPFP